MLKSGETTSSGSIYVLQVSDNFRFSVVEAFVGPVAALLNTKAQTSGTQYGKPWSILVNFITSTRTCSFEKGFLLEGHMNAYDQSIPKLCSSNSGNSPLGAPALLCQVGGPHTHTHAMRWHDAMQAAEKVGMNSFRSWYHPSPISFDV